MNMEYPTPSPEEQKQSRGSNEDQANNKNDATSGDAQRTNSPTTSQDREQPAQTAPVRFDTFEEVIPNLAGLQASASYPQGWPTCQNPVEIIDLTNFPPPTPHHHIVFAQGQTQHLAQYPTLADQLPVPPQKLLWCGMWERTTNDKLPRGGTLCDFTSTVRTNDPQREHWLYFCWGEVGGTMILGGEFFGPPDRVYTQPLTCMLDRTKRDKYEAKVRRGPQGHGAVKVGKEFHFEGWLKDVPGYGSLKFEGKIQDSDRGPWQFHEWKKIAIEARKEQAKKNPRGPSGATRATGIRIK